MNAVERIPQIRLRPPRNWRFYLVDTLCASIGPLFITAFITYSNLYPRIVSITMLYMLLIIWLATVRSRYSAILASVVSFLSIDFFLTPPLFSFAVHYMSAAIALFVFLVVALITSQLASMVRRRADEATESEHKLRILYELLRVYSLTNKLDEQLDCIALSTNRIFSTWGIIACVILLPDRDGRLQVRADAPITIENFALSDSERQEAQKVLSTNLLLSIKDGDARGSVLHLIPLRTIRRPFGVLYLRVKGGLPWLRNEDSLQQALNQNAPQATFFWAYLDEISGLVERALAYQQMLTNQ